MRANRLTAGTCCLLVLAVAETTSAWESFWTLGRPDAEHYQRRAHAVVVVPSVPSTIYIATTGWIYKSLDGGTSWETVSSGLTIVSALAIDPVSPHILYAGNGHTRGVYKSTDAGGSWSAINSGMPPTGSDGCTVTVLTLHPHQPQTAYAGTWDGVFRSDDAGETWVSLNNGLLDAWSDTLKVNTLAVAPSDPQTLYVGGSGGFYVSRDGGGSWSLAMGSYRRNLSVYSVTVHPTDPLIAYASTSDGWVTTSDGGTTEVAPILWTAGQRG